MQVALLGLSSHFANNQADCFIMAPYSLLVWEHCLNFESMVACSAYDPIAVCGICSQPQLLPTVTCRYFHMTSSRGLLPDFDLGSHSRCRPRTTGAMFCFAPTVHFCTVHFDFFSALIFSYVWPFYLCLHDCVISFVLSVSWPAAKTV